MSLTFDKFLNQLHAQGREKGDGFDASHFDGMTEDERQEARQLLENALIDGDNTAAFGLVLLDGKAAEEPLRRVLEQLDYPNDVGADVAGELYKMTGKKEYQEILIQYLHHPKHLVRQATLVYLSNKPCSENLKNALSDSILGESNETVQFLAVKLMLYCQGLISNIYDKQHSHKQLVVDLTSKDKNIRREALDSFL